MPFNGAGLFTRVYQWVNDEVLGLNVDATRTDTDSNDIAAGLSNCVTRDGQSPLLANLPAGGFKITDLDDGSTPADSVNYGQVFNSPTFNTPSINIDPALTDDSLRIPSTHWVNQKAFAASLPAQPGGLVPKILHSINGVASWLGFGIKGADIASAATINLSTATGDFSHVTGNIVITGITIPVGEERTIIFDGNSTLTHSVALLLPGGINIVTAPNDRMIVRGDTAGAIVIDYTRASALPLVALPYMWVRDEKPSGTDGGSSVAATITQTRTLNIVKTNTIAGAVLAANQITLPAGTYQVNGRAPAFNTQTSKAFFYNVTDATYTIVGSSTNVNGSYADSVVKGTFTISAPKDFTIRHYTNTVQAVTGLGEKVSTGQVEVYAEIEIWKVA